MKKNWRIIGLVILTGGLIWWTTKNFNEGKQLAKVIEQANWWWLSGAIIFQLTYYWFYSFIWKKSLQLYEINWGVKEILTLTFGSLFVNLMAPSAGLGGAGIFVQHAKQKKERGLAAAAGYYLGILMEFLTIATLIIISFLLLWLRKQLDWYELIYGLIFLGLVGAMLAVMFITKDREKILIKLLTLWQRIRRRNIVKDEIVTRVQDWDRVLAKAKTKPGQMLKLWLLGLLMQLANIISLALIFLSLGLLIDFPRLLIGLTLMILFLIVSPVPQGIGVVESLVPLALSSLGINFQTAFLGVLIFRGINLWLPLLIGFGCAAKVLK